MHFEHTVSRGKCAIAGEVEDDGMIGSHQGHRFRDAVS
jgi:hypothetical protein